MYSVDATTLLDPSDVIDLRQDPRAADIQIECQGTSKIFSTPHAARPIVMNITTRALVCSSTPINVISSTPTDVISSTPIDV